MTIKLSECCEKPLIDVNRLKGRLQRVNACAPPSVWAKCSACGDRTTVLASKRWELAAPWDMQNDAAKTDRLDEAAPR